jgi:hypothetical protein
MTPRRILFQLGTGLLDDSRAKPMIDAVRVNVLLIAMLAAASAVNGIIFYNYL